MNSTLRKVNIGLFGSSHIQNFPHDLFKNLQNFPFTLHPIHISSSPKNLRAILGQNTVTQAIRRIQTQNIHLHCILILVGANDIGRLTPTQIAQGIIHIADRFQSINIQPLIVPIFNRLHPKGIEESFYKSERSKINRRLRAHYRRHRTHNIIGIKNLKLDQDGVHLTTSSYRVITKAVAHHIKDHLPHIIHNTQPHPALPTPQHIPHPSAPLINHLPPGHHFNEETGEEVSVEFVYVEQNQ